MNKIVKLLTAVIVIASLGSCKKNFDNPPGPGDPDMVANTTIHDLKARHTSFGAYDVITTDVIISGIVVADDKSGNLYKQLFIQDSTGGLQILLDANSLYATYPVGRKIFIRCNGLCISDYNRTMQLGIKATVSGSPSLEGIPSTLIDKYVVGGSLNNPVVPILVTAADLGTTLQDRYIGSLIQLDDYEFIPSNLDNTYSDTSVYKAATNDTIKTCSANSNLIIRTSAYANFAAQTVAQGHGSIIAIYTVFASATTSNPTKQLIIRDTSDVKFYAPLGCPPPPGSLLFEDFESQVITTTPTPYNPVTIPNWMNIAEAASVVYTARSFSSNKYAYISGFGTGAPAVTTWLVTKGVNMDATNNEMLSFKTNQGFILTTTPGGTPVKADLKILVSNNYTGTGNPWAATWDDVTSQAILSPGSTTSTFPSGFTNSGSIPLNTYTGTVYVAFRYEGADPAGTTSDKTSAWEIDDVKIMGN